MIRTTQTAEGDAAEVVGTPIASAVAAAAAVAQQHEVSGYTVLVLNLGEGWRSVAR